MSEPGYPASAYPEFAPPPVPDPGGVCRGCGSAPAAMVTFRGHQGFLVMMRYLSRKGPFCRDCGLATFRSMTVSTMWAGWWGLFSLFINTFVLGWNLIRSREIAALAAPQPTAYSQGRQPLDPGAPILGRVSGIFGALLTVAVLTLIAVWLLH
jgi:hypothetical protein